MSEKRSFFLMMLNTTPKETAASYATVGDGVTELTANYNPQTSTEQFIRQDSATTELTGYQPNAPVTSQVVRTERAFAMSFQNRRWEYCVFLEKQKTPVCQFPWD